MTRKDRKKRLNTQRVNDGLEQFAFKTAKGIGSAQSLLFHTAFFIGAFSLRWFGVALEDVLLILTTAVSLEAIYLAIFIQMTVNKQSEDIEEISEEVEEISEDIEEISEDIEEIQEDMEENEHDEEEQHRQSENKLQKIESTLHQLLRDIEELRRK